MFKKIKGGTLERICDRFDCWIPPVGYGLNAITGNLEQTDIIKRSSRKSEQFWQREEMPEWYKLRRRGEIRRQRDDPDYFDQECEAYRAQEWKRRLCGVWFLNNGNYTYITGTHYLYLQCWKFQGKHMEYRDPNRKLFYVWDYCVEDPNCLGLIEITKRKDGKTARAGCILYEYISRTFSRHGGIQSKTDDDAEEVFQKAVIEPWQKLPDFFRPIYDTGMGSSPAEILRFYQPSLRGKQAEDLEYREEALESFIDFQSRKVEAYDGPELHRYVSDEAGKMKDVSIRERHNTVMMCSEVDAVFVGKHLYTTTVEEMDSGGGEFLRLVQDSNFDERNANGRTKTGLYVYFLPAYETMFYDKYGMPNVEEGKKYHLNARAALVNDEKNLQSYIRKNPFTLEECFTTDSDKCLYNAYKLTERQKAIQFNASDNQFGNFIWKDGIKDSEVVWEPNPNGRWEISWMPEDKDRNRVHRDGNILTPYNTHMFISGCDTYDHNTTEDSRNSKAASFVKCRTRSAGDDAISKKYICKYHYRPPMAEMVYEDLVMQSFFFGCQMLPESNKPGVINYFIRRGYGNFLVHVPGYKEPGIPSTQDNKREASLMVESYIEQNIHKMDFLLQIIQLLQFDIKKTEKFDLVMAMLWTEYADNYRYFETEDENDDLYELDDLMPQYQ